MTGIEAIFQESSALGEFEAVPLGHLSVELGHLYMEDFAQGPPRLRQLFKEVAPWAATVEAACANGVNPQRPRISTCFLIDDYFNAFSTPAEVLPMLVDAAGAAGLRIDYIAREASCVEANGIALAELVTRCLVADPPPGTNGSRKSTLETGWLANGGRSPEPAVREAMRPTLPWQPPHENAANRHSVFVDVELWSEHDGSRLWSCPFLAAVWQLLRLGVLRANGKSVVRPVRWQGDFPRDWRELPPIVQLNPSAEPFSAYRTFSVLAARFLPIEHAVRTILGQVEVDKKVRDDLDGRLGAEKLELPAEVIGRIEYAFAGAPWRRPR